MSYEWTEPVATELIVIKESRLFRDKLAANRVVIKGVLRGYKRT